MSAKSATPYHELMQRFADEYAHESGKDAFTTKELAVWAVSTKRWEPPADLVLKKCREDFAKALREQYITDENGQSVRAKHVARILRGDQQLHLWADIRNAPRAHMETAFQQRREQIAGDCRQLNRDVRFYNKVNSKTDPIQMVFDFTDDIEEGAFSGEYPVRKPDAVAT